MQKLSRNSGALNKRLYTNKKRGCVISHIQYALKGQKLLAQGSALGYYRRKLVAL